MTKTQPRQEVPIIDIGGAARLASVSERTVRNWHKSRVVSAIKINRVLRFHRETFLSELQRFSTTAVK